MKHLEESHSNQTAHWVDTRSKFSRRKWFVRPGARNPTLKSLLFTVCIRQRGPLCFFLSIIKLQKCIAWKQSWCPMNEVCWGFWGTAFYQWYIYDGVNVWFSRHLPLNDGHVYDWILFFNLIEANWLELNRLEDPGWLWTQLYTERSNQYAILNVSQ